MTTALTSNVSLWLRCSRCAFYQFKPIRSFNKIAIKQLQQPSLKNRRLSAGSLFFNLKPQRLTATANFDGVGQSPHYADTTSTAVSVRNMFGNNDMVVIEDFIDETEEKSLLAEIEPYMARLRYEYSHWDDAIHGYRETERSTWNAQNSLIITRLKDTAFGNVSPPTEYVHVLDLEESGKIKPHKDAIRYCGDTISGISLLTDSVMRLVCIDNKDVFVDVLLKRRSLYIMRHTARYDFTHEILPNDLSYFKQRYVHKGRRISVICRNSPISTDD